MHFVASTVYPNDDSNIGFVLLFWYGLSAEETVVNAENGEKAWARDKGWVKVFAEVQVDADKFVDEIRSLKG